MLKGEGLHQHHLIPQSLFSYGPAKTRDLIDYVPSVPLAEAERLKTLHSDLNNFLKKKGFWQRSLSSSELRAAITLTAEFYEQRGLRHFAAAIRGFCRPSLRPNCLGGAVTNSPWGWLARRD